VLSLGQLEDIVDNSFDAALRWFADWNGFIASHSDWFMRIDDPRDFAAVAGSDDVDFKRQVITVQAAYAKNGESRSVPMNDLLTTTLQGVRINSKAIGPVFLNRNGEPYRSFRTAFERAVRKAAIPDFTFHDLGHTFASRLVMAGVDLPTVKELMGHKNITMTLRYTHLSSDHKRTAVGKLAQFGKNSHQFSQHGVQKKSGNPHKLLKNNTAPLAQLDRASDF
jgi:hypothetical protein